MADFTEVSLLVFRFVRNTAPVHSIGDSNSDYPTLESRGRNGAFVCTRGSKLLRRKSEATRISHLNASDCAASFFAQVRREKKGDRPTAYQQLSSVTFVSFGPPFLRGRPARVDAAK